MAGFSQKTLYQWSGAALRCLLGALFLWSGIAKALTPKDFARSIDAFGLVPEGWLVATAILLPVTEIMAGLAVILRWRFGLPLMAALLLLFIGVLGYGLLQGLDVDCGCFSLAEQKTRTSLHTAFWRDWLLLAATAYVLIAEKLSGTMRRAGARPVNH